MVFTYDIQYMLHENCSNNGVDSALNKNIHCDCYIICRIQSQLRSIHIACVCKQHTFCAVPTLYNKIMATGEVWGDGIKPSFDQCNQVCEVVACPHKVVCQLQGVYCIRHVSNIKTWWVVSNIKFREKCLAHLCALH